MKYNKHELKRVLNTIDASEFDAEKAWKKMERSVSGQDRPINLRYFSRIAAGVMLLIGSAFLYIYLDSKSSSDERMMVENGPVSIVLSSGKQIALREQIDEIIVHENNADLKDQKEETVNQQVAEVKLTRVLVPKGEECVINLPDGTIVNVYSGSEISFPQVFDKNVREVKLIGEAFFDVTKNSKSPFVITAGLRKITVLGTRFNVSAYSDDTKWTTTLVSGKVKIDSENETRTLMPSQQCVINTISNQIEISDVDIDMTLWNEGKFPFRNYSLNEIMTKLGRWYDFEVVYSDNSLRGLTFRGVIDKNITVEENLKNIENTTNIQFIYKDKTIYVDRISR